MERNDDAPKPKRGLTPDCVRVGELRALRFLLKHAGTCLELLNTRPTDRNVRRFRTRVLAFYAFYPAILAWDLYRRPNPVLGFLQRLRFHGARPLTFPKLEGGGYNFVDYLRRYVDGEIDLVGTKSGWNELFVAVGVKTPERLLTIDADTPLDAAERLPQADVVVRPNFGQRGKHVNVHAWDAATGKFDGEMTPRQLIERYRGARRSRKELDTSVLVTRFVKPSSKLPFQGRHQHLRITTVNTASGPIVFRTISLVQRDPAVKVSNYSRGGELFNVDDEGRIDGEKLFGFDRAAEDCRKLQAALNLVSCGWDLILTDDGPYFLEGNILHGVTVWSQSWCYEVWRRYYELTGFVKLPG